MALTAPKPEQIKFAKQVAWERGQRLVVVPQTSSELSGVIQTLLEMDALPITDEQVERIRQLTEQAITLVEGFVPNDVLPDDRAGANKLIYSLRTRISRVKYHAARANAASFLAPAGAEVAPVEAETVVSDEDAPF